MLEVSMIRNVPSWSKRLPLTSALDGPCRSIVGVQFSVQLTEKRLSFWAWKPLKPCRRASAVRDRRSPDPALQGEYDVIETAIRSRPGRAALCLPNRRVHQRQRFATRLSGTLP